MARAKKHPKKRKPEQQALPGPEYARKVDPRIEAAEREITEARTAKAEAKKDEEAAAEKMVAAMAAAGVDRHQFTDAEGIPVEILLRPGKVRVIVRRKKPRATEDGAN